MYSWADLAKYVAAPLAASAGLAACESVPSTSEPYGIVFLVRHAEMAPQAEAGLSDAGLSRAERLATELSDAGLDEIWTMSMTGAVDTAEQVAKMTGAPTSFYTDKGVDGLADTLSRSGGTHLIVGDSVSVLTLVDLLADDPAPKPANDGLEYDRFYTITLYRGWTETTLERY